MTTLPALLARQSAERADATAFIVGERRIGFAAFEAEVAATAAWLAREGIGPGDRVAVWLVNRIEWLALLFALARRGATLVAVNTRYRGPEVAHVLGLSGARLLVMQREFRGIDFPAALADVDAATLPALERVAVLDAGDAPPASILGRPTLALAPTPGAAAPADKSAPELPVVMFTTSGTTKAPKLVTHSQANVALHVEGCAKAYGFAEPGAVLLAVMPFCGTYGLTALLAAFAAGAPALIVDAFDADEAAALIRTHAVTHVFGSDEMLRRLGEAAPGHDPFPTLRVFGYAAFSPGAAELARSLWVRRFPLHGLYGSSEVFALFSMQPAHLPLEQRIEAGGATASPDAEIRIRELDGDTLLPPGESGEIEIRAPANFTGYFGNPQATADAMRPDGYFRTGDIGRLREDGSFVYESRRDDAIRLAGFLVNPAEIEDVLKELDGVADAQVVAVKVGDQMRAVAFVIPAPGVALQAATVIAAAKPKMAPFKLPARVWFVDEFPTTPSANGTKIQRGRLRDMAAERVAGE